MRKKSSRKKKQQTKAKLKDATPRGENLAEEEQSEEDEGKSAGAWFDESFVLRASRVAQTATTKLEELLVKTMNEGIGALKDAPAPDTPAADEEQAVLKYRLSFLVAVRG